jgi:lysophospholipase L1-like esterase
MNWTKKELAIVFLLSLFLPLIALIGLELASAVLRPAPDQRDRLLGWKLKENYHREFTQKTLGGKTYLVSFRTNKIGLRYFGENDKAPIKILVLGDSYTMDPYASDDRMWYAKMTQRIAERTHRPLRDFYVLAGGTGGWGTYQELLLSERLSHTIKPNLFVLQFCSNDFQNNSYEWETKTIVRGQYMRRPYASLDAQGPKYVPGIIAAIYRSFIGESRLFNRIDGVIGGMQFRSYGGYARPLPDALEKKYERDSIPLTKMLLTKLRENYRDIPALMVNCDANEIGPNKVWKTIAQDAGFIPLSGPSDFIRSLKPNEQKDYLLADGSHLSDEGNQLYGAIAGDEIASLRLTLLNNR